MPSLSKRRGTTRKAREQLLIVCDSAEPKSIADLRDAGLWAIICHKAPGCVEYRIKWLQHLKKRKHLCEIKNRKGE